MQIPSCDSDLHRVESEAAQHPGVVEQISDGDFPQLGIGRVFQELGSCAVEDAARSSEPAFIERYRHAGAWTGDVLLLEVVGAEGIGAAVAQDLGFLRCSEVVERAARPVMGLATV